VHEVWKLLQHYLKIYFKMKKLLFGLLFFGCTFFGFSQTTKVLSTDDGDKTVTINSDGTTDVNFSTAEWAQIMGANRAPDGRICITIANRHQDCDGGIGFRCRIFDCPPPPTAARSRVQPVTIITTDAGVIVKFSNVVDWDYLMAN